MVYVYGSCMEPCMLVYDVKCLWKKCPCMVQDACKCKYNKNCDDRFKMWLKTRLSPLVFLMPFLYEIGHWNEIWLGLKYVIEYYNVGLLDWRFT